MSLLNSIVYYQGVVMKQLPGTIRPEQLYCIEGGDNMGLTDISHLCSTWKSFKHSFAPSIASNDANMMCDKTSDKLAQFMFLQCNKGANCPASLKPGLEISGGQCGHGRGCPRHWPRCPRENYYYQGQYWPCPFYPLASVPFAGIGIGQMRL